MIKEQPPQTHGKVKRKFRDTQDAASTQADTHKFRLHKRNFAFIAVAVVFALTIPLIFATAANTNEVAKIEEVKMEEAGQSEQPEETAAEETPVTTDGELASDLTEATVQPEPTVEPTPEPTPTPEPEPTYTELSSGMTDEFVKVIQQRLMDLDYMENDDPTSLFGPVTTQAIEYFQRKNGLSVTGTADVETQALLFSDTALHYTVSEGTSGPDVQSIQERLAELGYSVSTDGSFGAATTSAVKYFQRMNGLSEDGNVGNDTREILYSQDAEPSLEYWEDEDSDSGEESVSDDTEDDSTAANDGESASSDDTQAADSSSDESSSSGDSESSDSESSDGGSSDGGESTAGSGSVESLVNAALAQVGKTYVLGGKGPDAFDCSGLVYYSLQASGNGVSYMTSYGWSGADQYAYIGSMSELRRGDIVCVTGHVGIYLGDGQIVNASSSNGKVIVSTNVFGSSYWTSNFICGRRLF